MHRSKYSVIGYKLSDHMSWSGAEGKQKSENIYACAQKNHHGTLFTKEEH